ncbi:MAG: RnfABCDGE type electron transport complex subunit D, partial [Clostridia bacterium]|nr:RnfABCDGE type electron transport complex subunit D [Clostridia bacterium]
IASWPVQMTNWVAPGPDAVSTVTPLAILGGEADPSIVLPSLTDLIIGNIGGCIGETSAAFLILGGVYLVYKKVITPRIPLIYIGTVAALTLIIGGFDINYMLYHIFAGGLMLGAIFMATDYASSPITPKGQVIFALGCGIITTVIRVYGGYPEGVSFAILFMNVAAPLLDKYTSPRLFGEVK